MKNIVVYTVEDPRTLRGGMERATYSLVESLMDLGMHVMLLCRDSISNEDRIVSSPVQMSLLPRGFKEMSTYKRQFAFREALNRQHACLVIDQLEGDIIGPFGIFSSKKSKMLPSCKYVAVLHSSAPTYLRYYTKIQRRNFNNSILSFFWNNFLLPIKKIRAYFLQKNRIKSLIHNYDAVVLLSEYEKDVLLEFAGISEPSNLYVIPNTVPLKKSISEDVIDRKKKQVLYVGRMDNQAKGVDRLLRIWKNVYPSAHDWELILVGTGQDEQMLRELAKELKLENYKFEGYQTPDIYYSSASIFCMTSSFEGFGLVLVEAMQYGCVPFAFNSYPAVNDIIEAGKTGCLIPPFDEQIYSEQLLNVMQNREHREEMARASIISAGRFSPENIAEKWVNLLNSLETNRS